MSPISARAAQGSPLWALLFLARKPSSMAGFCSRDPHQVSSNLRVNLRLVAAGEPALAPEICILVSAGGWYNEKTLRNPPLERETVQLELKFSEACVEAKPVIRSPGFLFHFSFLTRVFMQICHEGLKTLPRLEPNFVLLVGEESSSKLLTNVLLKIACLTRAALENINSDAMKLLHRRRDSKTWKGSPED